MSFILRLFLGISSVAIGSLFVVKTEWFIENFGYSGWAEEKLGGGGSRLMYKFIGLAIIFLGLLGATGLLGGFLIGTVGKLFVPNS